jgi:hypothetical protein
MGLVAWLDERFYPGVKNSWDNTMFREYVLLRVKPDHTMLDLGAGAGSLQQMNFRGLARKVCGVDPEESVTKIPILMKERLVLASIFPSQMRRLILSCPETFWSILKILPTFLRNLHAY